MRLLNEIGKVLSSIFTFIFPYFDFIRKSLIIQKRIADIDNNQIENNLQYVERLDNFSIDILRPFYEHTLEIKKSIEDKSKALLLSITVSVTLIVGLAGILVNQDKFSDASPLFYCAIFLFGFLAVMYMVIGAVATLRQLSGKMTVYQMFPADSDLQESEKVRLIAIHTEQNANMNKCLLT